MFIVVLTMILYCIHLIKIFQTFNKQGVFNEENFNSAMTVIREGNDQQANKQQGRRNGGKANKV